MNLLFIYKNPIILSLLKIATLKVTLYIFSSFNILFKTVHHWKIDFLQSRLFLNLTFNEHFLRKKRL